MNKLYASDIREILFWLGESDSVADAVENVEEHLRPLVKLIKTRNDRVRQIVLKGALSDVEVEPIASEPAP